jgi:uracil-DNA glycosylase
MRLSRCAPGDPSATIACVSEQPQMNKNLEFLARKQRRIHEPHVQPLTTLIERWRREGLRVPYADPDLCGIHARILFLAESPGPRASTEHGSGLVSPDNKDASAGRFWRLSREAGLSRDSYINWNVVPWYVSGTARNKNATAADGQAALPYLHEFVTLLPDLRVVVVMGRFAQQWWFRYLIDCPGSRALPVLATPHTSSRAGISNPRFQQDILAAMVKARQAAR